MYYYKARIYSPTLGRFLQTDPIGYEDQYNLYAYVGNDPINGIDPFGLAEVTTSYSVTGSRFEETASVTISDSLAADLTQRQLKNLGKHFSGFIRRNDGASLTDVETPDVVAVGGATKSQVAFTKVVAQFINYVDGSNFAQIDRIIVGRYDGDRSAPGGFAPNGICILGCRGIIGVSTNPRWSRNFTNGSEMARVLAHESLHATAGRLFGGGPLHYKVDEIARRFGAYIPN